MFVPFRLALPFCMHERGNMKYIKKEDVITLLTKLRDAREQKRNCSKQSATEYAIYDYVLKVVDTIPTVEKD